MTFVLIMKWSLIYFHFSTWTMTLQFIYQLRHQSNSHINLNIKNICSRCYKLDLGDISYLTCLCLFLLDLSSWCRSVYKSNYNQYCQFYFKNSYLSQLNSYYFNLISPQFIARLFKNFSISFPAFNIFLSKLFFIHTSFIWIITIT